MKNTITLLFVVTIFSMSQTVQSKPSINTMQTCQALLDFLEFKLQDVPAEYPLNKVKKVREGLIQYNEFIQKDIITPKLLQLNPGNKEKANSMQIKIDEYKAFLFDSYTKRFSTPHLVTDFAISVNNCAKEAVPSGEALENLKYAINTIVELAQTQP